VSKQIKSLLAEVPGYRLLGPTQIEISNLTWDYQKVAPGCLYFCLEQEEFQESHINTNAFDYWEEAVKRGAVCLVTAPARFNEIPPGLALLEVDNLNQALALITKAFYDDPFAGVQLVGITGTNGKTTTSQLLDAIYQTAGKRTGVIGTIGIFFPDFKEEASHLSNPMATELFSIGARMKEQGVQNLIMEVTSHGLAFERNHALDFDIAIFTNLSQDHLDFHGTLQSYKQSKLKHFQALGKGKKKAFALVNLDDPIAGEVIQSIDQSARTSGRVQVITYGVRNPRADLVAYPHEMGGSFSRFEVRLKGSNLLELRLPMPGLFNIYNSLAAFGAALAQGISIETIQKGLSQSRAVDGRFERLHVESDFQVFIDYAHTPDGLLKICEAVRQITAGRLILVFGCGGDRDALKRPQMGKIAAEKADIVVLTADNPRSEDPAVINEQIKKGVPGHQLGKLYEELDRAKAVAKALHLARPRDAVLIAGKGHETYQLIKGKKLDYSDRAEALNFFLNPQREYGRARLLINLGQLAENWRLIYADKPAGLKVMHVVKDDALGIGMLPAARAALRAGVDALATATLDEALELRQGGITQTPILLFGERLEAELDQALREEIEVQVQSLDKASALNNLAQQMQRKAIVHLKVDTGMGRYGVHWTKAVSLMQELASLPHLEVKGIFTHFAMSDEADKTHALLQIQRFDEVLAELERLHLRPPLAHACNSGGYLDLPQAHYDLVRLGTLPTGVYPSEVCRRIQQEGGLKPLLTLMAKVAWVKDLAPGETAGYGMHFKAEQPTRLAVLPLGYGDGYPRMRNKGEVLIQGQRCPIRGGISMDATLVEVTGLAVQPGEEAVLIGHQGEQEITPLEVARQAGTVTYDVLACWTKRLLRHYI